MVRRKNSANTNIKTSFLNQMHFLLSNILVIGNTAIHHRKPKGFHLYLQVFVLKLKCFELKHCLLKISQRKTKFIQKLILYIWNYLSWLIIFRRKLNKIDHSARPNALSYKLYATVPVQFPIEAFAVYPRLVNYFTICTPSHTFCLQ